MTPHEQAIEAVARALVGDDPNRFMSSHSQARALLAQITPLLTAADVSAQLAAALAVPEVVALHKLLNEALIKIENDATLWVPEWQIWSVDTRTALSALEARHDPE